MSLVLENASFRTGGADVLLDAVLPGGAVGVFGPSGAGKSTLLELVCGIRKLSTGRILLHGRVLEDVGARVRVPPELRGVGLVPQDAALFPHLTVERNLLYGLRPGVRPALSLAETCDLLGLGPLRSRGIDALSGGERQRVAIGRALLSGPRLLLLDEPLAGLDAALRSEILPCLRRLRLRTGLPLLMVSHSPHEIASLCDDVVVMEGGRILQAGPVAEVFRRPRGANAARVLGVETVVHGRLLGGDGGLAAVQVGGARLVGLADQVPAGCASVVACIRAEDVVLLKGGEAPAASARNRLAGTVRALEADGFLLRVEVDCGFLLTAQLTRQAAEELCLQVGGPVCALIKVSAVHLIEA